MIDPFSLELLPVRILFGQGAACELHAELERLGCRRPALLSTPRQEAMARRAFAREPAVAVPLATMHTPVEATEAALARVKAAGADGLVAIGGGSTTGLSKALALRTGLPQICLPTTYAGSEVTAVLGETRDGVKTTQKSLAVLPETVIYDVNLTFGLPAHITVVSGMNAVAHAVEALYARDRNPLISILARQGIASMLEALPALVRDPLDIDARSSALYAAWACGTCLGSVGMSLHHKLCHVLGGSFGLPHAETHAVMLPYAIAYNAPAGSRAHAEFAALLNSDDPAVALYDLGHGLGVPPGLGALGLEEGAVARAVDLALASPYWNPEPIERQALRLLLDDARLGRRPRPYLAPVSQSP